MASSPPVNVQNLQINDQFGHAVGDQLLIEAAKRLKNCTREMDTVARFGGDEFVVMLCDLAHEYNMASTIAKVIIQKILEALSKPYRFTISDPQLEVGHHCTVSFGMLIFNAGTGTQEEILKWADIAMYEAKEAGGNQFRIYSP